MGRLVLVLVCVSIRVFFAAGAGNGYYNPDRWVEFSDAVDNSRMLLLARATIDTTIANPVKLSFAVLSADDKDHFIVQFAEPISEEARTAVEVLIDNSLDEYIPHNSFVVFTNPSTVQAIQNVPGVVWVGEWDTTFKHQSSSGAKTFLALDSESKADLPELIIQLPKTSSTSSLSSLEALAGSWTALAELEIHCRFSAEPHQLSRIRIWNITLNGVSIATESDLEVVTEWLARRPEVMYVHRRETFSLNNYWARSLIQNDEPSGLDNDALLFDKHGITGQNSIIGVSDSGIDARSCFFHDPEHNVPYAYVATNVYNSSKAVTGNHRKIAQYIIPTSGDSNDNNGHGTHVSGTLAGKVLGSSSLSKFNGVASDARVAFFDIQKGDTIGLPVTLSTNYLPYSYSVGARISSNSWGSKDPAELGTYTLACGDIDRFVWDYPDMLIVFAAGNQGSDGSMNLTPPATSKNVVAVGATSSSSNMFDDTYCGASSFSSSSQCGIVKSWGNGIEDDLAEFSSVGPTQDGRIKPDLVAPGLKIVSASRYCNGSESSDLYIDQGTSMAAPHVASHLHLVRQYLMQGYLAKGVQNLSAAINPSAALLKALAISGSFEIRRRRYINKDYLDTQVIADNSAPDKYQGFGRLKLNRVLNFADNAAKHTTYAPRGVNGSDPSLKSKQTHSYTFCVSYLYSSYPPRFTLVWTDYPSSSQATTQLVQNLDLTVNTSDNPSAIYYPNELGSLDAVNTVERVVLPGSIQPGVEITVQVNARSLPIRATQPYALVATGRIVQSSCQKEFPGGYIPSSRYKDESLTSSSDAIQPSSPKTILDAIEQTNPVILIAIAAFAGTTLLLGVCGCYCAISNDSSCCTRRRRADEDDDEMSGPMGQFSPSSLPKPANTKSLSRSHSGKAVKSYTSASATKTPTVNAAGSPRHHRTASETIPVHGPVANPTVIANNLPPIRSSRRESNLSSAW